MHTFRSQVWMLVALLVVTASGCPCVYAGLLRAAPAAPAATPGVRGTDEVACPFCCCGRTHERRADEPAPKAGAPARPAPPPCARRGHGEGLAPDVEVQAPPPALALPAALLPHVDATLTVPVAPRVTRTVLSTS